MLSAPVARIRVRLIGTAAALALFGGAAHAQVAFLSLPSQPLSASLMVVAEKTGKNILFTQGALTGVQAPALKGRMSADQAVARLIRGTDLEVASVGGDGLVVRRAQQMRSDASNSTFQIPEVSAARVQLAQAAQAPAQVSTDVSTATPETVVVTGSRVITDITNSPTPLTEVSPEQLLQTTPSTTAVALTKLPMLSFSSTARNAGNASSNGGGNYLNLRNFGQQRTLVLQDGMRVPPTNANGSVDVSILPQMLVSRVDIITGGASSVYGSDAVTGVVNFILDKNFDGLKYNAAAGLSTYADGFSHRYGVAAGTSLFGGRGHLEGELGWNHQDEVLTPARPRGLQYWSSYGTGTINNPITNFTQGRLTQETIYGLIYCKNCTVNGQEFRQNNIISPIYPGIATPSLAVEQGGDGGWWSVGNVNAATTQSQGFGRFSYKLNDDTVFFAQATAAESRVYGTFIPVQEDFQRQNINYFKDNPFLSAADQVKLGNNGLHDSSNIFQVLEWVDPLLPENAATENMTRRTNSTQRNLTFTTGFEGLVFKDFSWDFHYTHGEGRDSVKGINNGNNQYHDAQQDAVLYNGQIVCYNDTPQAIALYGNIYPGCVPIDAFGPTGITKEAFNYWSRTTEFAMTNKMDDVAADITGNIFELPAGPIRAALSGEMRWLDYIVKSDASPTQTVNCYGLRLCGNSQQAYWDNNTLASVQASENVWEFSGEVNIPILKDVPLFQDLSTDIAGRYTDYSVSGEVQTWKVGIDWRVDDDFRLRGTTSVDIRAPTLNDLYQPSTQTSIGYFDNLTNFGNGLERVSQGNPNLVPEVSRTYTAGIVYTPTYIPGFTASVDFYNIKMKNAIGNIAGDNVQIQNLCNASGGTSIYCSLYVRPYPPGSPQYTTPANYPLYVLSENLNAALQATEGEDYEIDYAFDAADMWQVLAGMVNLRLFLNTQPIVDSIQFPGAQVSQTTSQKGHAAIFAGYTLGTWSVDYQLTWFSDLWKNAFPQTPTYYAQPRVPSFNSSDITVTKKLSLDNGDVSVFVSVQNVFNAQTPVVTGSPNNPGVGLAAPFGEDVMGRYFTIGVRGAL